MKEKLTNQITRYSFVLTVFVIWMHAGEALISSIPGQIAVPGFFILSGFLFFLSSGREPEENSRKTAEEPCMETVSPEGKAAGGLRDLLPDWLIRKLKRRIHTLLIPYLLWNLIYFLIYLVSGKAKPEELPAAVLHYSCNPVFWYLFQLILIMLLTPLLNCLLKRKRIAVLWLGFILTCAVFYNEIHQMTGMDLINSDALFYFSLGGFTARFLYPGSCRRRKEQMADRETVEKTDTEADREPEGKAAERKQSLCAGLGCMGAMAVFIVIQPYLPAAVWNFCEIGVRVSGAFGCWFFTGLFPELPIRPWMKITFFIYATHYCVIRAVWAAETALGWNENLAANIAVYLLMPAVCTAAAWALYVIMKKYTPKLLCLLTGGRG